MKTIIGVLTAAVMVVGTACPVRAQCDASCSVLTIADGTRVFTCYQSPESHMSCTSTLRSCTVRMCETALLTDPTGQTVGMASLCGGNVTVRSIAHTPKPRSVAKLRTQRDAATVVVARKAKAPSVG